MKNAPAIHFKEGEHKRLMRLISTGREHARVLTRARILLQAAEVSSSHHEGGEGHRRSTSNRDIANVLHVSERTVSRTRQRYVAEGLEAALYDRPRTGRPLEITGDVEAKVTMLACSAPPDGHDHWTLQLLANRMVELEYAAHISDVAVMKVLKKTNCALGRSRRGASPR
jgi:transposase